MQRKSLAWILLPAVIVVMVVAIVIVSNFQKEVGMAEPGRGGRAAVAAVAEAQSAAAGDGAAAYAAFSNALAVAAVEARNMAVLNPAENRLRIALERHYDCLLALREAWQAELDKAWDPAIHGSPAFWTVVHPDLGPPPGGPRASLTAAEVRRWAAYAAQGWLRQALDLVG